MKFTAQIIANYVNGVVDGNANAEVSGFAKIEEATPGTLTFLANPKYTHYIYNTQATIVLVRSDFEPEHPVAATLIRVADPYATLSQLMTLAQQATAMHPTGIEEPSHVSPTATLGSDVYVGAFAYIGEHASIADSVKIYPQAYVGADVAIGEGTVIYPGAKIYHGCRIGRNCVIHAGAVVGADGFGFAPQADGTYSKIPQLGNVEIADNVEIGANTTVDRATMGSTRIAAGTKLDNLVQVAHNVEIGQNTVMAAQVGVAGSAKIGDNCMIGGQVGFAGHITVGHHTTIGAQSGIPNNVAEGSRLMGYPAVPAADFARTQVRIKRLQTLFDKVAELERRLGSADTATNTNV